VREAAKDPHDDAAERHPPDMNAACPAEPVAQRRCHEASFNGSRGIPDATVTAGGGTMLSL